jgi:two-component sensor histidine kinase
MVYRDRGSGYPETVLAGERRSVGLELVQMIVSHSLRGSWVIRNENGAVTEIRFPSAGRA